MTGITKNKGFTLIELIIVIVILGILAATAVPLFLDLQRDARISAIDGLMGAVKSSSGIVYAKSVIRGLDRADNTIIVMNEEVNDDANNVTVVKGYPEASAEGLVRALDATMGDDIDSDNVDWWFTTVSTINNGISTATEIYIMPAHMEAITKEDNHYTGCGLVYSMQSSYALPTILSVNDKC